MVSWKGVKQSEAAMFGRQKNRTKKTPAKVIKARIAEAGKRARAEAEARRKTAAALPPEHGGQPGLEPTRYGDWEKKGLISDF